MARCVHSCLIRVYVPFPCNLVNDRYEDNPFTCAYMYCSSVSATKEVKEGLNLKSRSCEACYYKLRGFRNTDDVIISRIACLQLIL